MEKVFELNTDELGDIAVGGLAKENAASKRKLWSTLKLLLEEYKKFADIFEIDIKNDYTMDVYTLRDVVGRYFRDVRRIHAFQDIQRIDCHKIGGYLCYWFAKLRPIKVRDEKYLNKPEFSKNINELFALVVSLGRISSNLEMNNFHAPIYVDEDFTKTFVYNLKYRQTTGDNLSMVFYFLEKSALPALENSD
ncbi:MAG: hypothetical protein FWG83_02525 [Oscillospiraceae bacterium]|nr:hypothetical protein [Oscillospiraceae bacterium]